MKVFIKSNEFPKNLGFQQLFLSKGCIKNEKFCFVYNLLRLIPAPAELEVGQEKALCKLIE